jgi:3-oxoacyl-(acyl-carrier-protein) synthase
MHNDDLPPPVSAKSRKAQLWAELCACRDENDAQQREVVLAREAMAAMRAALANAHLRLSVIRADLGQHEAP